VDRDRYPTAINDLQEHGIVQTATYATYSDWIRGDMAKRGKQEQYLREILGAILKRYAGQVTWNGLAKDLSVDDYGDEYGLQGPGTDPALPAC